MSASAPSKAPSRVRISSLASGGEGVARLDDGRVVFVEGGVPGDLVLLELVSEHKRMVRARIERLLEPSLDRVEPLCAHFGRCGGCLWQQIAYPTQLAAKREILRAALERIGGLALEEEPPIVASPAPYGYRARARLIERDARLGFRRRGSHELEAIEACPVLIPAAEDARRALAERLSTEARTPTRQASAEGAPRPSRRRAREIEWELLAGAGGTAVWGRVSQRPRASEQVKLEVLGETLQASRGSFVQGNALLWDALAGEVRRAALEPLPGSQASPRRFVEIHAGIGFLTLPIARQGLEGVAIESSHAALRDLSANLARADLADRVRVLGGRVERRKDLTNLLGGADLLLLDPPRVGLDVPLREAVGSAGPARIVYVSCDPATLARDLRPWIREGAYRVESLCAFDLFPQTPHVETVASLAREQPA
ncbi:MAG: class I SAM-dependent RNA methyltransferase [Deltaproteobacteria bacterium]|nr:class I SAM-dependent RNA methyltransferase [Deltaproteobacteria bacterium]